MIPTRCSLIFGDQVGIVHHRITTFFVILNNFGLFPKDLQLLELQLLEVVEIGATRSVGSVPAVYQFLSVEQKSKVIFVPGFIRFYFFITKTYSAENKYGYTGCPPS